MAVTATRTLDNYIAGQWTPVTDASDVLDVTNPATGEVLARVPLSGCGRPRRGGHGRARGAARVACGVDDRTGAQAVRAARAARCAQRGPRSVGHDRDGQDARRRARRGRAHDRDGRVRLRDPDDDAGPHPRGRLAQHRRRDDPPAGRRLRRDRAVQLPGDGAVLVPAVRDRLRQHVRPQALRAGAADPADRVRGARRARSAAGRREPRQRRPRGGRGDPRSPGHRRGLVRRLGAGRQASSTSARPRRASASRRSAAPRTTWS